MPYPKPFERALRGIANGWKPREGSLAKITPEKADAMLSEAKDKALKGKKGSK